MEVCVNRSLVALSEAEPLGLFQTTADTLDYYNKLSDFAKQCYEHNGILLVDKYNQRGCDWARIFQTGTLIYSQMRYYYQVDGKVIASYSSIC